MEGRGEETQVHSSFLSKAQAAGEGGGRGPCNALTAPVIIIVTTLGTTSSLTATQLSFIAFEVSKHFICYNFNAYKKSTVK